MSRRRPRSGTPMSWWQETYEHLRVRREDDGGAVLVLDLPERRNMMSAPMTASWRRAVAGIAQDPGVRCVVVSGAGAAFSSGGDLAWIGAEPDAPIDRLRARMDAFYRDWLCIADLEVPTVAAVSGAAGGAGHGAGRGSRSRPRAPLCPAVRRRGRPPVGAVHAARDAPRHAQHLVA